MEGFGGFDHNAQSLRVVTRLERKYAGFDGLNLTWETLEGLAKHNGPEPDELDAIAKVAQRLQRWQSLDLASWPSAEAQVAALADDIAYVSHDIDDGCAPTSSRCRSRSAAARPARRSAEDAAGAARKVARSTS